MKCAYCMAIVFDLLLCIINFFVTGSFSLVLRFFIDGICAVALAFATKTMSGATVHLLVVMLLMNS